MADAAMEFLLNNLKELLVYHSHLITDTRNEIESLEKDLRLFNAFLKDSLQKRRKDERTKELVRCIRDVVYEVEDVVDAFVTRALEKRSKAGSYLSFLKFWEPSIDLYSIGKKVEEVNLKVEQAKVDFATLNVDDEDSSHKPEVRPPRQKDVVGFEDVTRDLILCLTKQTDYFDVVSLIGMFGLGKTTLAWKIFNDPAILYEFPIRIWLPISQEFSLKDTFLAILKEFTTITDVIRQQHEYELAKMVSAKLETSSFLIVMDDVWSPADWDRLRDALPNNNNGKVLITSRIEEVGNHASCPRPPHKLRFFDQDESWELLRLEAIRTPDCPPELEEVGKFIASNCGGLPLAIVVIGGILATKFSALNINATRSAWESVSTQVGIHLTKKDPAERMNKFISLSYDKLPYHLRACFLYLGMFPEDFEIPASQLIQMWIGEGFIQQNVDTSSLEEIAEKYLDDLINRNLVRIEKFKYDGKVKTCRIHDTLRDFCRAEAANENVNFFQEIKYNNGVFVPPISDLNKYRRLSIHSNCLNFISSKPAGHRARSFVCFSKDEFILPQENIPDILTAFKLLRVLDVKPIKFPKINSDMFRLVHARYIAMSFDFSALPSKFSELWNIQTLIVDTTSRTLDVKANIWKMSQLRHFKTNASAKLPKPSKDSKHGAELQTLGTISVESCTTELFDRACNLKQLGIRGQLGLLLEGNTRSFDSLGKMKYLEKLKLINDVYPLPLSGGHLSGFPQHYQFPKRLRSLTLHATFLSWNYMSNLAFVENLEVLKLKHNAFMGRTWNAVDGGFRKLVCLHIEHTDLAIWDALSYDFPRLRGLVLKNCDKLLGIPAGLADITSFQTLELYVSPSAAASAKIIQKLKKEKGVEFKLSIFPPINVPLYQKKKRKVLFRINSKESKSLSSAKTSEMAYEALDSLLDTLFQILKDDHHPPTKQQNLSIHDHALVLLLHLENVPKKSNNLEVRVREAAETAKEVIKCLLYEENGSIGDSNQLREAAEKFKSSVGDVVDSVNRIRRRLRDISPSVSSSPTTATTSNNVVVGFDQDLEEIKNRLTDYEAPQLQVLSIVGRGGIGKTTLAKIVYDDELIMNNFDIRAWVIVSQDYSVESILANLLASLEGGIPTEKGEIHTMKSLIHTYLKRGRYLVVIDDMCSKKAWDDLKMIFPDSHYSSWIILTTRLHVVVDSSSSVYMMRLLDARHSWDLLKRKVFANECCPLELEDIGKGIAENCGGLPLSIVVVAGILSKVPKARHLWKQIAENEAHLETIISLSYIHLPVHLRPCFLYMGGFPEDYEFHVSELTKLWFAEGFLEYPTRSKSLEEQAQDCLENLVERSLVLVSSRKFDGRIKSCSLHDIMRDFCVRQAEREKLILPVMDYLPTPILRRHFLPRLLRNHSRLSVASHDLDFKDSVHTSCTHSIICIPQRGYRCVGSVQKFTLLRVFHLLRRNNYWDWEAGQVYDLVFLTYLAFSIPTSIVPPAISQLQNLQTLIIYRYEVVLPVEIWRLRQLRHLMAFSFLPLPQPERTALPLQNLEAISVVTNFVCSERMVAMIANVKKLKVCYLEEKFVVDYVLDNLNYLCRLEKLKLQMHESGYFASGRCPKPAFPLSLRKLTLCGWGLPWKDMTSVGSLPNLQVLKLRNYACSGTCWETMERGFGELRILVIEKSDLQDWRTESSNFPRLECLMLHHCPNLSGIPSEIGDIPTLKLVAVDSWEIDLMFSAERIKEKQRRSGNDSFQVCVKRSSYALSTRDAVHSF